MAVHVEAASITCPDKDGTNVATNEGGDIISEELNKDSTSDAGPAMSVEREFITSSNEPTPAQLAGYFVRGDLKGREEWEETIAHDTRRPGEIIDELPENIFVPFEFLGVKPLGSSALRFVTESLEHLEDREIVAALREGEIGVERSIAGEMVVDSIYYAEAGVVSGLWFNFGGAHTRLMDESQVAAIEDTEGIEPDGVLRRYLERIFGGRRVYTTDLSGGVNRFYQKSIDHQSAA